MQAGDVIASRYRLVDKLGAGGMGEVWRAVHAVTDRPVAVKCLHPQISEDRDQRSRFMREARASAHINHPNVVDVLDAGEMEDGGLFLAMELLNGVSLEEAMAAQPPLNARDFLVVVADACRGLSAAHGVGIVHRDIKPGNIFLHREKGKDEASGLVLDFGISKFIGSVDGVATSTGAVLGSPRYMSPEQIFGSGDVDHRTDIWSIGVLLFRGFTGCWTHQAENFTALCIAIGTQAPYDIDATAPALPQALRTLIKGCLLPRDQRWADAGAIADQLEELAGLPEMAALPVHSAGGGSSTGKSEKVRVRTPSSLSASTAARIAEQLAAGGTGTPYGALPGTSGPNHFEPPGVAAPADQPNDVRLSTAPSGTMASPVLPAPRRGNGAVVGLAVLSVAVVGLGAVGFTLWRGGQSDASAAAGPTATAPGSSAAPQPEPAASSAVAEPPAAASAAPEDDPTPEAEAAAPPSASASASVAVPPAPRTVVAPRPRPKTSKKKKKVVGEDLGSGI